MHEAVSPVWFFVRADGGRTTVAATFAASRRRCRPVESSRMRVRVGRWAALGVLALAASSAPAQVRSQPPSRRSGRLRAADRPRRRRPLPAAPVSLSARKVYEQARSQLVQIRTVLKGRASQTSVGSGFLVSAQGHIVTNFHVVSEAALKPDRHDLVYVTADGREAPLHDPAARRAARPGAAARRRRGATARARPSTRCRSAPPTSRSRRASASIRSATRSTSASRSRRAPTTAWCGAASIRRSSSAARSRPA